MGVVALRLVVGLCAAVSGCDRSSPVVPDRVVLYTSLDRSFSEPIIEEFQRRTGIRVDTVYDTESTKTVGLVNRIRAEAQRPRCDVFWNNEIVNTVRLKHKGVLTEYRPQAAQNFPPEFRDRDGKWTGFAARARVLIVNTELVKEEETPAKLSDLLDPKWQGKIGIAKPLFGSTATWVATIYTEDLARMHGRAVQRADADDRDAEDSVLCVQHRDQEVLAVLVGDELGEPARQLRPILWAAERQPAGATAALPDQATNPRGPTRNRGAVRHADILGRMSSIRKEVHAADRCLMESVTALRAGAAARWRDSAVRPGLPP